MITKKNIFGIAGVLAILSFSLACIEKTKKNELLSKQDSVKSILLFAELPYGSVDSSVSSKLIIERLQNDSINTFINNILAKNISILLPHIKAKSIENENVFQLKPGQLLVTDIDHLNPANTVASIDSVDFFENPGNYPLQSDLSNGKIIRSSITQFNITGVTAIARGVCKAIDRIGIDSLLSNLAPYFEKADYVHISNEVSFTDKCECVSKTLQFCSKKENFEILKKLHCSVVELTGNHNRDYGDKAFMETLNWYKQNNIKTFGGGANPEEANAPLILTLKDSTKLGIIGFNEFCPLNECADVPSECGANRYDSNKAKLVLQKMKQELKCDFIIASVQFGESDSYIPTSTQKNICKFLIQNGADMVYGSQAHQVQQIVFIKNKPVFYGLGNFIFDQLHKPGLRQGYFLELFFYKQKLIQARPVFTYMGNNLQQQILKGNKATVIKKEILK